MIMGSRNHPSILLLAAFFIFAAPAAGHADNLFRIFPEAALSGLYGDNVPLRTTNPEGDFVGTMAAGFFLDYTSAARYASLHYDTFAQLFAHDSQYDRAGEAQYVNATDYEYLSPTTKLRIDELYYRDEPGGQAGLIASDEAPLFNTVAYQLLLANDEASINSFDADLTHDWERNWSSELWVHQETLWSTPNNNANYTIYYQTISGYTEYHFTDHFSLGPGYQFFDFMGTMPGVPDDQKQWPFVRAIWRPMENLYLDGRMGVLINHTQGTSGQQVNPAGEALVGYTFQRVRLKIQGGEAPELTYTLAGVNEVTRFGRGQIFYDFTQRLTGSAGAGFYEYGSGFNSQIISWGFGLSDRVSERLRVYASFVQLRRNETASSQFLPSGTQSGHEAVGNYFVVGFAVSAEAFRWSWL